MVTQSIIRKTLRTEGVLAPTGTTTTGRPSVAIDIMDGFHENGIHGPARPISLDWSVGPSYHLWNREATSIVAQCCLEDLQKDPIVVVELGSLSVDLNHDLVLRHVKKKLGVVSRAHRRATEQGPVAMTQRDNLVKKQHRRTTRRYTVGHRSVLFVKGTYIL